MIRRSSHTQIAVLIQKKDFFGPTPAFPNYATLPEQICICAPCFDPAANLAQWRALNSGNGYLMVFSNSPHNRPARCHLCGRHLTYEVDQPQHREALR
jgi:hypothetical protein